jgi:endonuclease/exonuclease/phosphatase family metal-dependent hydrolase
MKKFPIFTVMVCLLMCSTHTYAQPAETQSDATTPAATQEDTGDTVTPIKVMSFNVRWGGAADPPSVWSKRRDRLLATIQAYDPDILGVQEATLRQAKFLRNNMDGYIFFGAGRDNGKLGGEMCAVYYRGSRFRRAGGGHFWLSEEPDTPGSYGWGASYPRMVTWLRLRDKTGGKTFIIANTHFDHRSKKARLNSGKFMREKMMEIAEDEPVVIMGDFNCDEDSEPYAALLGAAEGETPWLTDAYRSIHPKRSDQEATYHGFRGGTEGSRIDWVLYSPGFTALNAGIDTTHEGLKYPSDHFPVTATLQRADHDDAAGAASQTSQ